MNDTTKLKDLKFKNEILFGSKKRGKTKSKGKQKKLLDQPYHRYSRHLARLPPPERTLETDGLV
jgi:hypothetical protein